MSTSNVVVSIVPAKPQPSKWRIIKKLPWHTMAMVASYIAIFYTIPRDSEAYVDLAFDSDYLKEAYRWWTYSLLHYNTFHIYGNMIMLIACGALLEYGNYQWRTFCIYNLAILGGACGCGWSLRFLQHDPMTLVGASGGVYGLLAGQTGYLMMNWNDISVPARIWNTSFLVVPTSIDIILSAIHPNPQISYSTHVGGFITGAMASICLVRNIRPLKWENIVKITTGCVLGCTLIAGFANLLTL